MSEIKGTKALELWCKRLVRDCPEVKIENMTTSWRDGMAFCALVHHFRPDLIDMSKLKNENIYENNQLAFSVAEKYLGIPALLDPEDMVENDVPDRLSILTYLSQFYQRLGHTVTSKVSESDSKTTKSPSETAEPTAPIKFGKTGLDKCTACGLPVYLAQRLMVSHKLYHRRCFRCSKCSGHLNPKNYHVIEGSEFSCDSCKNDKALIKYLNNNDHDQMGMLAFGDDLPDAKVDILTEDVVRPKQKPRPTSILEKINMFERNSYTDKDITSNVTNISLKDNLNIRYKDLSCTSEMKSETDLQEVPDNVLINDSIKNESSLHKDTDSIKVREKMNESSLLNESSLHKNIPEKVYKSNIEKFNFLQTQLSGDAIDLKRADEIEPLEETYHKEKDCIDEIENDDKKQDKQEETKECSINDIKEDCNITDDIRIAKIPSIVPINVDNEPPNELSKIEQEINISVPPRRKKQIASEKKTAASAKAVLKSPSPKEYPYHLNPFSDDEEEEPNEPSKKASTNPFGSSDEENDDVPPIQPPPKVPGIDTSTPVKRLIAVNPFWSDGEEPSSDEEDVHSKSSKSTYSSMATSTPNLPSGTPARRVKPKAPPPPPVVTVTESSRSQATSMDDVASISSLSSYNSTFNSEQRTPSMRKKAPAPTPPDSLSTVSEGGALDKETDSSDLKNASGSECGKKAKGPAPGLPLPERREVKLQMSPEELQVTLDLLETQQLGLERQGVLIERMIRDKCEGDEACVAPQEEVEDLVIQLCELVNEKNDLFRKQTELMYIRRQQRLEQEQADIEHEIRVLQSRPAVNRIDADKAREEHLVSRLVEIVRLRDELVQQLDAERRRERQEDLAIAASIASKRAQRNSDSSMKSVDVATTYKKSKVKEKVKKQLKKAKHTLYSKKKEDPTERKEGKEDKTEKEKKSK